MGWGRGRGKRERKGKGREGKGFFLSFFCFSASEAGNANKKTT